MNESSNMYPITSAEILETVDALAGQARASQSVTMIEWTPTCHFELVLLKELLHEAPSVGLCIPAPLPHHQHPRCHPDLTRNWLIDLSACIPDVNLSLFFHPWETIMEPVWPTPIGEHVPLPQMRICAFVLEVLLGKLEREPEAMVEGFCGMDLEGLTEIIEKRPPCAECGQLLPLKEESKPILAAVQEALGYLNDAVREREDREEAAEEAEEAALADAAQRFAARST